MFSLMQIIVNSMSIANNYQFANNCQIFECNMASRIHYINICLLSIYFNIEEWIIYFEKWLFFIFGSDNQAPNIYIYIYNFWCYSTPNPWYNSAHDWVAKLSHLATMVSIDVVNYNILQYNSKINYCSAVSFYNRYW